MLGAFCKIGFDWRSILSRASASEAVRLRLFETTGFQRGRYDHHHRGNFLIGLPKGGWLACLSDPVRPKTEVRCGFPPSIASVSRSWNWNQLSFGQEITDSKKVTLFYEYESKLKNDNIKFSNPIFLRNSLYSNIKDISKKYYEPAGKYFKTKFTIGFELEKDIQPWTFPGLEPNVFYGWRKYLCTDPSSHGFQIWKRVKLQNLIFLKFFFFKKTTRIDKFFTLQHNVESMMKISSIIVVFLETGTLRVGNKT